MRTITVASPCGSDPASESGRARRTGLEGVGGTLG